MNEVKEIQYRSSISDKATKETDAYKFVKELSEALNIPLMKNGSKHEATFYYIQENGLSVFTLHHKVSVVYQRGEEDAITNQMFPDKDLKLAILSAYKDARMEIQKNKDQF